MVLVLRRAALFFIIVILGALLAAAAAHSATRDQSATRDIVSFSGFRPGTIVVKTRERKLYYVIDRSHALRFPVGVGKAGQTWTGRAKVEGKFVAPAWAPPADIRRENPKLPKVIAGGATNNPMGAAALTLRGGDYAIHGTNRPESIGGFVSHGCIRMFNRDIRRLYRMVAVGTPVVVER